MTLKSALHVSSFCCGIISFMAQFFSVVLSFVEKQTRVFTPSLWDNDKSDEEGYRYSADAVGYTYYPTKDAESESPVVSSEYSIFLWGKRGCNFHIAALVQWDDWGKRAERGRFTKLCTLKHNVSSEGLEFFLLCYTLSFLLSQV